MLILRDFLPPPLLAEVKRTARLHRSLFESSQVVPPRPNYRESEILYDKYFSGLRERFNHHLLAHLAHVVSEIGLEMTECRIELQMTAHHNGNYFRRHTDNGSSITQQRRLSFVCYFLLTDRQMFSGGELKLYEGLFYNPRKRGLMRIFNPMPQTILPEHNSIVFFKPDITHEVNEVHCADVWEHGRFSVNGWLS